MSEPDESKIASLIPAEFHMISGSHDTQTSADVFNVSQFELPNPQGKAGGACTASLLEVLYKHNRYSKQDVSWVQVLREMREILIQRNFDQVPQLTSSRLIDVEKPMYITPPSFNTNSGHTKRALLIGINYIGQNGELRGCHNDVNNIKEYLMTIEGFLENNIMILLDDGQHSNPTKQNIEQAFYQLTRYSQNGDVVFIHYSGHGSRVPDKDGDEDDGYDETLVPVDFQSAGQIIDDWILQNLVKPMPGGVTVTVLMDCCHSGTAMDLPYRFGADDDKMHLDKGGYDGMMGALAPAVLCCEALSCLYDIYACFECVKCLADLLGGD